MAIHPGVGLRTPRTRAVEIGTASAGFEGQLTYNSQRGVPDSAPYPIGEYKNNAEAALPKAGSSPVIPTPFTLK
jgi:hypothetical protein